MDINSYKKTITELTQDLAKLEVYSKNLEMENTGVTLHELNERIKTDRFNLAVLGEFKKGKSALINALLRTPVLPVDILPTTACVNRITYDVDARAKVEFIDGKSEDIPLESLKDYVTQSGTKVEGVQEVTVWYPTVYCANNVDIYDTPGLNDSPEMTKATTDVISRMDIAIFTLSADTNFSMSESEFIGSRLLSSDVGRVIFVVTRMGGKSPEERERILSYIRQRINKMVLGKAERVFADNPEEFEAFKRKLGEIQIYGVDSVMALEARKNYDAALLEESGFPAFERAIDELLTRERGRVMLEKQTSAILKASGDIFNMIQTRMIPLTISEEEFNARCEQAEEKIRSVQALTDEECKRLDEAAERIIKETRENWKVLSGELRNTIRETALGLDIEKQDLKTRKAQEEFADNAVQNLILPKLANELQIYTERLQSSVNEAIGKECMSLSQFEEKVSSEIEGISELFELKKTETRVTDVATEMALNYISGCGGIRTGYRLAGKKGAFVGGLSGMVITLGSAVALGALLGTFGLVTVPFIAISSLVASALGFVGSGQLVKTTLWSEMANTYRQQIADEVGKIVDEILEKNAFDDMLCDQITDTFRSIKKEITTNTMGTLEDLQSNLQKTKVNFAAEKAQTEQQLQTYMTILESLSAISEHTTSVREMYGLDSVE